MNWKIGGIAIFIAFGLILPAGAQEKKGEPVKKIEPAKAPEPAKKVEPVKPAEPAKPAEPTKAAEPAKGPTAGQPISPTKKEEAKPAVPVKEAAVVVTGTAVDVSKTSIKVKDLSGKDLEVSITPKTVMKKDIKKGDSVEVTVKGKEAELISLLPPPIPVKEAAVVVTGTTVDVGKASIKVKDLSGKDLEFAITPKTVMKKGKDTIKVADIKKGDSVEVTAKGKEAELISLLPPPIPVKEAAVVVTGTTVDVGKTSIKVKDLSGKDLEVSITAKTVVKKGKDTIKVADIKKGDSVEVTVKGKEAELISLLPPPIIQPVIIVGNVEDVNVKTKTLKVREVTGKVNSLTLTDKTVIKSGDAIKKPEDIKRGDKVEITTRGGVLEAIALPVPEIPTKVKGLVEDVDLKAKIIKVKDEKGMVLSFEVPDKTDIKMGTVSKKIMDIEKGDTADVLAKGKVAQSIVYESLSATAGKEIQTASQEIESAKKAGAETLASELYEESVGLLKKAQEELKQKKYDWAVKDAKDSKTRATQAAQMANSILNELKK